MSLPRNPRSLTSLLNWFSHKAPTFKPQPSTTINPRRPLTTTTTAAAATSKLPRNEIRRMAQAAMFDYFYNNRGLQFLIAESMSQNAPLFNDTLLNNLHNVSSTASSSSGDDVIRSITRFLLYHPVNEFEPFFESLGLKPSEFSHLVPCDKMFLNEDAFLLENYHVFWNYGVGREKMGKIFKEAGEVFGYESGVLASKIEALEGLGFSKVFVSKLIVCTPRVLIGDVSGEVFVGVLERLRAMGFGLDWVGENLSEEGSYDWRCMHRCLNFLEDLCGGDESEVCELIKNRPGLVFDDSGEWTMMLAGFQTKLGLSRQELAPLFLKLLPQELGKCVSNLRHCFLFLRGIKMEAYEIGRVFRYHSHWLGASRLKHTSTFLNTLKGGKKRLCQVIQENPEEMKKWTMGLRVQPLPGTGAVDVVGSKAMKTQFLLDLGYKEDSEEMEKALRCFRGRGSELRERFDFLLSLGLSEREARDMVRTSPDVLTQASEVLEAKVNYLVNELGYPLSTLVAFPSCLKYTLDRMKLRFAMFYWLQERGKADAKLAISTILVYSDRSFVTRFVNRHPDGPKHFEELKRTASL